MVVNKVLENAFQTACKYRENSYSPYSNFKVGAAIKFKDSDKIYGGCNIENASFGATVCAERSALLSAVSERGRKEFEFIVVTAETNPPTPPCALCLQVLAEFCPPEFPVYLADTKKIQEKLLLKDLLPRPFNDFD